MTHIWLRHPVTSAAPGLCYGQLDLGWGDGAEAQVASALRQVPLGLPIWSSPLVRCRAFAERVAARDAQPVILDDRLREMHFGSWEGRTWDAIDRAESDPWAADYWSIAPPGGESFRAVHARVAVLLAEIPPDAVIVTHAGVIRAAQMILTGAAMDAAFATSVPFAEPLIFGSQAA